MKELCTRYGISRKTGYKFINRMCEEGSVAARDRSKAKLTHANITKGDIINEVLKAKRKYIHWGPAKIRDYLKINAPNLAIPATSTLSNILKQHGLVKARKKRLRTPPYTQPLSHARESNSVWSVDFKGQFNLGDSMLCYPITITDNFSRFILCCKALSNPTLRATKRAFEFVFKTYGLPDVIRSDNGQPFVGTGIGGFTKLSVWWLKLGIKPERIKPGHPEQNGRHERMHKTLKQETVSPPYFDIKSQEKAFKCFKLEYNTERPHEALKGLRPADVYEPSKKVFHEEIPEVTYVPNYIVRRVRGNGELKHFGKSYYISKAFSGELLGLEPIDHGKVMVYFMDKKLCIIDPEKEKIDKDII
jgi:putative transposase